MVKSSFLLDALDNIDNNNVYNNLFDIEGGLFEETNSVEEIAFKYAVDHINRSAAALYTGGEEVPSKMQIDINMSVVVQTCCSQCLCLSEFCLMKVG